MGGMISQELAIRCPSRVLSLTSIMSTTGDQKLPGPPLRLGLEMVKPSPREKELFVSHSLELLRKISSKHFDEREMRTILSNAFDRSRYRAGVLRQMLAIFGSPDRTSKLQKLTMPVLVIHGAEDKLVPLACGLATAKAIPGSELLVLPEMAHDLPRPCWPKIVDQITLNAARAEMEIVPLKIRSSL